MRLPRVRVTVVLILIAVAVVAMSILSFSQGRKPGDHRLPSKPATKVEPAKAASGTNPQVTRRSDEVRFRIVDADRGKPIGLARVVIDNGNLAPELGADSDAVTWPDGRAIIGHRFFFWEERRGDQKSGHRIFQGPWIHVTAAGYEPRKMPLSELLEQKGVVSVPFEEAVVTLRRSQPGGTGLAELAGDYTFGDGYVHQRLVVSLPDRYHFKWHDDVSSGEPHDDDRYESRGRCSVVDGVLRLVPEGPFSSDLRDLMGNDFVPVRWEARRYLIPEKDRLAFCSVVNQGDVPRYMRSGHFSLRDADRRKPPEGRPEVPPAWASFLLPKPVTGTITEVLENEVAIMNVGARDGLKAGMVFSRDKSVPFSGLAPIKVLFTETDRSFVRIDTTNVGPLPNSSSFVSLLPFRDKPLGPGEKVLSRSSDPKTDF
jgi:hypothetical protein